MPSEASNKVFECKKYSCDYGKVNMAGIVASITGGNCSEFAFNHIIAALIEVPTDFCDHCSFL